MIENDETESAFKAWIESEDIQGALWYYDCITNKSEWPALYAAWVMGFNQGAAVAAADAFKDGL